MLRITNEKHEKPSETWLNPANVDLTPNALKKLPPQPQPSLIDGVF
jgi:hypothetical protein